MIRAVKAFLAAHAGATSVEYALIAVLISVTIIGAATTLGGAVTAKFQTVGTTVGAAGN